MLEGKFGWEPARVELAVAHLARIATLVVRIAVIEDIPADPADNRVLEAAAAGDAVAIVSGDRHLLSLGKGREIPIQTPADFLAAALTRTDLTEPPTL